MSTGLQHGDSVHLTFSVRGLSARDEILFKSFVRLLAHRTHHHWSPVQDGADVLVVPPGWGPAGLLTNTPTLVVGALEQGTHCVRLPFQSDELEAALNRIGGAVRPRGAVNSAPRGSALPAAARLMRWPPAALLNSPQRIRLAALMTGQAVSLASLPQRASVPADVCQAFFQELLASGLLTSVDTPPADRAPQVGARQPVMPVELGLLSRIRSRLAVVAGARA